MTVEQVSIVRGEISKQQSPCQTLLHLATAHDSGCLSVSSNDVDWFVYLDQGQLLYATHSVDTIGRFDLHLKRLSYNIPLLTKEVRTQVQLSLTIHTSEKHTANAERKAIELLLSQKHLNLDQAAALTESLSREALESFLLVQHGDYQFTPQVTESTILTRFDLKQLLRACQKRLLAWQTFAPKLYSPYQRPYLFSQLQAERKLTELQVKHLGKVLKGSSFRHLAVLLKQDELSIAQNLHPLVLNKAILLREPEAPFDRFPSLSETALSALELELGNPQKSQKSKLESLESSAEPTEKYTIACIGASQSTLDSIQQLPANENIDLTVIDNAANILPEITQAKPDLVLVDADIPKIDCYDLCRLIRNHSSLPHIPVVMIASTMGIVDRAKARLAGAADCISKPCSQIELIKMLFKFRYC